MRHDEHIWTILINLNLNIINNWKSYNELLSVQYVPVTNIICLSDIYLKTM